MKNRPLDRRVFVKAGGLALVSLGLDPIFLTRAAYAVRRGDGPANRKKTLICVFQRGAVDGLNMVVPHGDRFYYADRPGIAVPQPGRSDGAIDLDGHFGLHPSLGGLLPYYRDGSLAIVHAVGSPVASRSHFDAQDFMESGTPGIKSTRDGWLNRYMAHAQDHADTPFRGVAMGSQLPRALLGTSPALAIQDLRTFGIRAPGEAGDRIRSAFEELYGGSASGLVASSAEEGFDAMRMLRSANPAGRDPDNGARYPAGEFGSQMQQLAQLIKGGDEVWCATESRYDVTKRRRRHPSARGRKQRVRQQSSGLRMHWLRGQWTGVVEEAERLVELVRTMGIQFQRHGPAYLSEALQV